MGQRLDPNVTDHPKFAALEGDARLWADAVSLWFAAWLYCRRMKTGGFIPWAAMHRLTPMSTRRVRRVVKALDEDARAPGSAAGLLRATDDGCIMHDWGDHSPDPGPQPKPRRGADEERRRKERDRKRAQRRSKSRKPSQDTSSGRDMSRGTNGTCPAGQGRDMSQGQGRDMSPPPPHTPPSPPSNLKPSEDNSKSATGAGAGARVSPLNEGPNGVRSGPRSTGNPPVPRAEPTPETTPNVVSLPLDPQRIHGEYVRRFVEVLPKIKPTGHARTTAWHPTWERVAKAAEQQAALLGTPAWDVVLGALTGFFANEWARSKHFPPAHLLSQFSEHLEAGAGAVGPEAEYERKYAAIEAAIVEADSLQNFDEADRLRAEQDELRRKTWGHTWG